MDPRSVVQPARPRAGDHRLAALAILVGGCFSTAPPLSSGCAVSATDVGNSCAEDSECSSKRCEGGRCAASTCTDGVLNGNESDVDCGDDPAFFSFRSSPETPCPPCAIGKRCQRDPDCASGFCTAAPTVAAPVCVIERCVNGVQDGDEQGVDCGGAACPACVPKPDLGLTDGDASPPDLAGGDAIEGD